MNPHLLFDLRPVAERFGWTLIHSTWQGAAVAALLWILLLAFGRSSARIRYLLSCVALAAVVAAMIATFLLTHSTPQLVSKTTAIIPSAPIDLRSGPLPTNLSFPARAIVPSAPAASFWNVQHQLGPWLPIITGIWSIGVMALALRHFGGWLSIRRMTRRDITDVDDSWQQAAHSLARRMQVHRSIRLVESARAAIPAVVGWIRPVILLPIGLMSEMSAAQVGSILAHEIGHIRRNDYLANLLQIAIETLLFYHPAVWWISRQIRQEREHCCDDLAVAACGDRIIYARALAQLEENRPQSAVALAAAGGNLLKRIRRIVVAEAHAEHRASPLAAMAIALVCATAIIALVQWPARAADEKPATQPAAIASTTAPSLEATIAEMASRDAAMQSQVAQRDELRKRLAETSQQLGVNHPKVLVLKRQVETINAQITQNAMDYAARKAGPATQPARAAHNDLEDIKKSPIIPEDLLPNTSEYRISPDDLMEVSLTNLQGSGVETKKMARVSAAGKINLPTIGSFSAAGQTISELEKAISKAYRDGNAPANLRVSVHITENRGRTFSIFGPGVKHAGQYSIPRDDFRLREALTFAVPNGSVTDIYVMRGKGDDQRHIEIAPKPLLTGDKSVNLVIRPGDTIIVSSPPQKYLHVLVSRDQITFNKKPIELSALAAAIRAIPESDRPSTILAVGAASDDVPVGRFMEVLGACINHAQELGMPSVSNTGVQPRQSPASQPATAPSAALPVHESFNEYVIGGRVGRPGFYAMKPNSPRTLKQALVAADVKDPQTGYATVRRREKNRQIAIIANKSLADIFGPNDQAVDLHPDDVITVSAEKLPSDGRTFTIRPAPHAGEIGEIYIGGHVPRVGVYSITGHKFTLAQMIVSAGGPDSDQYTLAQIRRRDGQNESLISVSLAKILEGTAEDLYLQPNDVINVIAPPPPSSQPTATSGS